MTNFFPSVFLSCPPHDICHCKNLQSALTRWLDLAYANTREKGGGFYAGERAKPSQALRRTARFRSFDLQVREGGEIVGLLGPNGSGKTTVINCILALLKYDKGSIEVFGEPMRPDAYHIKQNIGIVMQNVAVFRELSVYENIDYFCGLYVDDRVLRRELVEEAIEFVGLRDFVPLCPINYPADCCAV